jgi:bifunctional DNase/RNase
MDMIEMTVEAIGIDPQSQPLVLLRDEERKTFVPIWIGPAEAVSIQMELDKKVPPRPMTHDLLTNILNDLGIRLEKVTVNSFSDRVYYATLHLQMPGALSAQEIDARPSDAIALALRSQCPILVAAEVAEQNGIQIDEASEIEAVDAGDDEDEEAVGPPEIDKFMKLIDGVDLGDERKR